MSFSSFFSFPFLDFNNVLKQGIHKIDFKAQGVIDLTVKLFNVEKEKVKPPLLPRPNMENLEHAGSAHTTTAQQVSFNYC